MCGIAGLWTPQDVGSLEPRVRAMTDALAHRGPDGEGRWLDPAAGIALGHRRLAVVGLGPTGDQPMASASGRWVITYNGELYNAAGVGARLEGLGHRFRGTSDTEVLVEALDRWGPAGALDAIDGMFAFGAWDRRERRLVLARDRMGEKPLVYGPVGAGMGFASELRALRALPSFDASVDPRAVALFLRFKAVPAPWTIHPGTRKVPAGHWLEVRDGGREVGEAVPYWSLADEVTRGAGLAASVDPADPAVLDDLDATIAAAVASQLRADVPLGAFLSGGIDSSLVATMAAEQLDRPLQTFTVGSPDADHDEASHARVVADRLGADHTELVVTPADALATVPGLAATWDEPFGDSSQLPMLLVSRLASDAVTVALSGDGGDELFGGYNRHRWLPGTWSRARRIPVPVRRGAGRLLTMASPATWDRLGRVLPERRRPRLLGLKVEKFAGLLASVDEADAYRRLVSHWQDPTRLVPGVEEPSTLAHHRDRWPAVGLTEQVMAVDALTYLPDDVLVKVDRASMAVSLEARVPLLARSVVEHAARLPLEVKMGDGQGKAALRHLLARRHPAELFERPKSGFGIPIAAWLRSELRPWAEDLLSVASLEAGGLVAPGPVRAAWDDHLSGRHDRSYELWDVLMLQGWARSETETGP